MPTRIHQTYYLVKNVKIDIQSPHLNSAHQDIISRIQDDQFKLRYISCYQYSYCDTEGIQVHFFSVQLKLECEYFLHNKHGFNAGLEAIHRFPELGEFCFKGGR